MSDLPQWEREAWGISGPRIVSVLLVGLAFWLLATFVSWTPATDSGRPVEQHATSPACAELARLRSHRVSSGAWHAKVRAACARSEGAP